MARHTNTKLLNEWIQKNGPDGISKLAVESGVSASTISKIRCGSVFPKKQITIDKLCRAMKVTEGELFPAKGKRSA